MRLIKKPVRRVSSPSRSTGHSLFDTEIVIGVDPSLSDTGVAIIDQHDNVLKVESVKTKTSQHDLTRCIYAADTVADMVASYIQVGHIVNVFIEAIPFSQRPNGKVFTRHELVGMLKYRLRKMRCTTYLIQSKTIKLSMTGNGSAKKHDMQAAVYGRYKRLIKNDNIADALCAAAIGRDHIYKGKLFPFERLPLD